MKKDLDMNLVHGLCMCLVELNMDSEQFCLWIRQNKWISDECVNDIRVCAERAERIIKLCRKLEEKKKTKKGPSNTLEPSDDLTQNSHGKE